jgi:hypothetical protein
MNGLNGYRNVSVTFRSVLLYCTVQNNWRYDEVVEVPENDRRTEVKMMCDLKILMALALVSFLVAPAISMPFDECASNAHDDLIFSQENAAGMPTGPCWQNDSLQPPIMAVCTGKGLAFGTNQEFHPIRLHITKVMPLQPSQIRLFLEENKTIGEIKEEISKYNKTFGYRSYMLLGDELYRLADIKLIIEGDNSTLQAEVMKLKNDAEPGGDGEIVGHILLNTTAYDGFLRGNGRLEMEQGKYVGNYQMLLDLSYPSTGPPGPWLGTCHRTKRPHDAASNRFY